MNYAFGRGQKEMNSFSNNQSPIHASQRKSPRRFQRSHWVRYVLGLLIVWLIAVMIYQTNKPLPPGVSYESPLYTVDHVNFYYDLTYPAPGTGDRFTQKRQIYDRILKMIDSAQQYVIIDIFLFNDYVHKGQKYPKLSEGLADKLIERKKQVPNLKVVFITDEVNTNYNSGPNGLLEKLKKNDIDVVLTDVDPLRDSTPVYSAIWRTFFQWFGQEGKGWVPNMMATDGPDVTFRSYLKLINVKANHRKVVATENSALVSTGNVHDASAYHSNAAFEVQGPIIGDILKSEQAVIDLSGSAVQLPTYQEPARQATQPKGDIQLRYITEGKVFDRLLEAIADTKQGDTLWMGMFYLADKDVTSELKEASKRGVKIQLILDPNQNAFGQDKIGIPNRPVAAELKNASSGKIDVRWYNTTDEQYHTKMMYIDKASGNDLIIGGSSNFTPRNLKDYNLENDFWISAPGDNPLMTNVNKYFTMLWNNKGEEYTLPLSAYQEDTTWLKDIAYRLQLILGFTTF